MQKKKKKYKEAVPALGLVPVAQAELTTVAGSSPGVAKGDIFEMALKLINFAIMAIGILGVIMFIYAGFLYLTSAGDDAKITRAKNTMLYAIVGIAVAVLGFVAGRTVEQFIVKG